MKNPQIDSYFLSDKPLTIFMDIDGPLNGPTTHMKRRMEIKRDCVENLQYLVKKYEARICWISAWRRSYTSNELFTLFTGAELHVPEKQRLPNLPLPGELDNYEDRRGPIIERYCKEHNIKLDEILIIDDDRPETLMDRWLKVHTFDGLNYSRTIEAERILDGRPTKSRDALGSLISDYDPDDD